MAVKSWPAGLCPAAVDIGLQQDVQRERSRSGKISTFEMPGASWLMTLTFPNELEWQGRPRLEALILSLRGGANRLRAPYFGRLVPNGTLRGAPTLATAVSGGAGRIDLRDCDGGLRAGDLIAVGGQLVMVEDDVEPVARRMTVLFSPALRMPYAAGTLVEWNQPHISWVLSDGDTTKFPYRPGGYRPSFSIELMEDWS